MVTTGAVRCAKLQSNRHHQQTNTQLFTDWMPFLSLNQQFPSTERNICDSRLLCVIRSCKIIEFGDYMCNIIFVPFILAILSLTHDVLL